MILDLVTSYPKLTKYIFGFILLFVVTSLVCLYLNQARKRWVRVLETVLSLCDSSLNKLQGQSLSMLELRVSSHLSRALESWKGERSLDKSGSLAISNYFNGNNGSLMKVEEACELSHRLKTGEDLDNIFHLLASAIWRHHWLHSRVKLLATLYMDIARLFSWPRGTILEIYTCIIRILRRDNNESFKQLKKRDFLSDMRRVRLKKHGKRL